MWGRCVACGMTWGEQQRTSCHCVPNGWHVVNPRRMDELRQAESVLAEIVGLLERDQDR